ncbi:hypothetical protein PENSPDRAFT_264070 [Peniophora sp. CONT]|nr:hypothetical protein PENSPDRAFT_264070 [Peniophora sp. CONT]
MVLEEEHAEVGADRSSGSARPEPARYSTSTLFSGGILAPAQTRPGQSVQDHTEASNVDLRASSAGGICRECWINVQVRAARARA